MVALVTLLPRRICIFAKFATVQIFSGGVGWNLFGTGDAMAYEITDIYPFFAFDMYISYHMATVLTQKYCCIRCVQAAYRTWFVSGALNLNQNNQLVFTSMGDILYDKKVATYYKKVQTV